MTTAPDGDAEEIVCDTSFVGVIQRAARNNAAAETVASWSDQTKGRLDAAILTISVIALAEIRAGYLGANWTEERVAQAEATLGAYVLLPLDMDVIDKCAALRDANRRRGWNVGDNDLWIAATAQSRGCAVVSCDKDFCRIEGVDLIYLPGKLDAPQTCAEALW